jgi:hypothetical protein
MKVCRMSWVPAFFSKMAPGVFPCSREATLADRPQSAYTPAMTLKNTASLALVGMILATILLVAGFIGDVLNVARGLIPEMRLLTSFIYAFAGLSMVVFLYVFHKAQP